ncbi:MAG: hypothetical protein O3A08_06720, partial [Proteobacteria bacterium]|nr:hypothetical protein [Pseudomonadota bacterium]
QTPFWKLESEINAVGNPKCPQTLERFAFYVKRVVFCNARQPSHLHMRSRREMPQDNRKTL